MADHWDAWFAYHVRHPEVYTRLVDMTRQAKQAGHDRIGMKMLFEVIRWEAISNPDAETIRLDNNFHALYARLVMRLNPDLAGMFETRAMKSMGESPQSA